MTAGQDLASSWQDFHYKEEWEQSTTAVNQLALLFLGLILRNTSTTNIKLR